MKIKERAQQLKQDIPTVVLSLRDPQTPILAKILAFFTVAYAFSPIDLVPDFIPVLGYLDDLLLLPLMIRLTIHFIPNDIWQKNQLLAKEKMSEDYQKKWIYSLPIIMIWILIIIWIVKIVRN